MQSLFYTGPEQKGTRHILFLSRVHKLFLPCSCIEAGHKYFFCLARCGTNEGDQITANESPGHGLFSLGEVQTRRGRSVRSPAHISANMVSNSTVSTSFFTDSIACGAAIYNTINFAWPLSARLFFLEWLEIK